MNRNEDLERRRHEFTDRIEELYHGKITFNETDFINQRTRMKFYCSEHGDFETSPQVVIRGNGCPICVFGVKPRPCGHWNVKEHCEEEAKKYKNKYELQKKCYGCYSSCVRHGWLDEFKGKFYSNNIINYQSLEERNHLIYVYIFDSERVFYVGRTTNLERRDKQHRSETTHSDGHLSSDCIYKFSREKQIPIPQPIILEEGLNAIESQAKEKEWLDTYKEKGLKPLNKAKVGIGFSSLGASLKWTYEACKEEAKKYKTKNQFKIGKVGAYNASRKNKWLNDFFTNKKVPDGYWNDIENCKEAALKCKNCKDMANRYGAAYRSVRKHGWKEQMIFNKEK